MRRATWAALLVTALVAAPSVRADDAEAAQALGLARITLADAIRTAASEVPGGTPIVAELEMEDGKAIYSIELLAGGVETDVEIDAVTGEVMQVEVEDEEEEEEEEAHEAAGVMVSIPSGTAGFEDSFPVDKATLADEGYNPYFILRPGYRLTYVDGEDTLTITVLDETKVVDGVRTRVVEERETEDGRLAEISRNYFAIDPETMDVYYFGEDVDDYEDGAVAGHGGAWLSGVKGAKFGLIMPGRPSYGRKYYQEIAPGVAMDRAEVVELGGEMRTPAGTYTQVLEVRESSAIERGSESKWYAPGVGLLKDEGFLLTKIEGWDDADRDEPTRAEDDDDYEAGEEEGEEEDEDSEEAQALARAEVSMVRAVETALRGIPAGKAVEAELEAEDGEPVYEIKVLAGGLITEVKISAVTGVVVLEDEDDD